MTAANQTLRVRKGCLGMRILIQFVGGRLDGRQVVAESDCDESMLAVVLLRLCDYGTIGTKFAFIPSEDLEAIDKLGFEGAVQAGHISWPVTYVVTNCIKLEKSITVQVKSASTTSRFLLNPTGQVTGLVRAGSEGQT
jgi:hypothetical protein